METTLSGKVTQQGGADAGNPVPGVSVTAAGQNVKVVGGKPAVTDAAGSYSLKVSHRGSFTLALSKDGFESKSLLVATSKQAEKRDFALVPIIPLSFEFSAVRKSKMLIRTNSSAGGGSTQTFTNPLRLGTAPVTAGASYRITNPAGYAGPITVDPATGVLSFDQAAYNKVTSSRTPESVTVEAAHQGKTASYTFTLTDHFSPRDGHTSVVAGSNIYVIGGRTQIARRFVPEIIDNEVWRSSDGGDTWDRLEPSDPAKRFPARYLHSSVVRGGEIYVIAGDSGGANTHGNDVWKSADGKDWTQATGTSNRFIARNSHGSAVLGDDIYVVNGTQALGNPIEIRKSTNGGTSWTSLMLRMSGTSAGTNIGRYDFGLEVLENALYIMGGRDSTTNRNEVWESSFDTSGTFVWTRVSTVAADKFPGRYRHSSAVLGGALYVIGGTYGTNVRNDVWKSTDKGRSWSKVGVDNAQALGRTLHTSVVLDNAIYVIGGSKSNTLQNDVWKSTDKGVTWVNVHKNP